MIPPDFFRNRIKSELILLNVDFAQPRCCNRHH